MNTHPLVEFQLKTTDWGIIKFARPEFGSITDDPWGTLACLKGTPWGDRIALVPGDLMSQALHGRATPLMRAIGPPPNGLMRQIPEPHRMCALGKPGCVLYRKTDCHPCAKMPDCYVPPGLDRHQQFIASLVALAWKENRYVVVVTGDEFNL